VKRATLAEFALDPHLPPMCLDCDFHEGEFETYTHRLPGAIGFDLAELIISACEIDLGETLTGVV